MLTENEQNPNGENEILQDNIRSIQEICFFLKTFCSETELHTWLLRSKNEAEAATHIIDEHLTNGDVEYELPDDLNEIYPYEVYSEIFTYETVDLSKQCTNRLGVSKRTIDHSRDNL